MRRAREALQAAHERQAFYANKHWREVIFKVGDRAWLSASHLHIPDVENAGRKFAPRFHGPYKITEVISPVAYRLELPSSFRMQPVVHVSHLKEYADGSKDFLTRPEYQAPPPPEVLAGEEFFEIEAFRKHRLYGKSVPQFLVKWRGHGDHKNEWRAVWQLAEDLALYKPEAYELEVQAYVQRTGARLDRRFFKPLKPKRNS